MSEVLVLHFIKKNILNDRHFVASFNFASTPKFSVNLFVSRSELSTQVQKQPYKYQEFDKLLSGDSY